MALSAVPARASSVFPGHPFSSKAAGTTGAAFLKLPEGARYEALGGAAAAAAEGADSLFWNPAGLGRYESGAKSNLSLSYSSLLETEYSGGAAFAKPGIGPGALAAGAVYFTQSAITSYNTVGDPTGQFTPNDFALSIGYGMTMGRVRAGAALKVIRSELAGETATTGAVDAGIQADHVADIGDGALDLGAALSNLGEPIKLGSVASPLPFSLRGGAEWHASPWFNGLLDVVLPVDQDPYVAVGGEAVLRQPQFTAALRLGFNQSHTRSIDGVTGVTAGGGLDFGSFRVDYAWVPYGDLGMTNKATLAFRF